MSDESVQKNKSKNKNLTWGQLLSVSIGIYAVSTIMGGSNSRVGSVIGVGSYVLFMIAFVNAWKQGGVKAFATAIIIAFVVLAIGAQINLASQ